MPKAMPRSRSWHGDVNIGRRPAHEKAQVRRVSAWALGGALGGIRTPNLLIRSQMLYPLSYERLDNDEQEYTCGASAGQSAPAARSADPPAPLVSPLGRRREHSSSRRKLVAGC
jgi:hypothetical protein